MHHPIDKIVHTMAFVTPVVEHWMEQEIAQWVHPMKDRSWNEYINGLCVLKNNLSRYWDFVLTSPVIESILL